MVSRRRRFYPHKVKIETVKLVTDSDNSVTQLAKDNELIHSVYGVGYKFESE